MEATGQGLSYLVGEDMPGPYKSVLQSLEEMASKYANDIAVVSAHQPPDLYGIMSQPSDASYLRWRFQDFYQMIERLASVFVTRGVGEGMPVFTFLPNGVEFLIVTFATWRVGGTVVPINIKNLVNRQEVTHLIETALKEVPEDNAVLFVDSMETAKSLDEFEALAHAQRVVTGPSWENWTSFSSIIQNPTPSQKLPDYLTFKDTNKDSCIMFTSGSTSLPKGCHWHYPSLAYWCHTRSQLGDRFATRHGDVFTSPTPNNHAMGFLLPATVLSAGATLVYSSPHFEPVKFLQIAQAEHCTHTIAVPTMIYATVLAKANKDLKLEHLRTIILAGGSVTPEVLRLCEAELGTKGCEVMFGMTEGAIVYSGRSSVAELADVNGQISCGTVIACSRIKVCAPGSRKALPRGEVGELHSAGVTICSGYIGKDTGEFYDEDGLRWCATGDMGRIDAQNRVFIVGRYKEMIIRGGENISPVAIETALGQRLPDLRALMFQIVGSPDEIAGEVPVAVVARQVNAETIKLIKDSVIAEMGQMYSIDQVISLGDLGLQDYPRTLAGKIRKVELKEMVAKYRKDKEEDEYTDSFADPKLMERLMTIWARIVGTPLSEISLDTVLSDLGDSITLMRAKDRLFKQTGVDLTVKEMLDAGTLGGLLDILKKRILATVASDLAIFNTTNQPPSIDTMTHAADDEDIFEATKSVITTAIARAGLEWEDVRDVMPALDFEEIAAKRGIFPRFAMKISMLTRKSSVEDLRRAVIKAAANNPMQSSFIVWDTQALGDDIALQVTVEQSPEFLNKLIEDGGCLSSIAELKRRTRDMMQEQGTRYPGPLFRAQIFHIEETQSAALIHNLDHTVTDATCGLLFMEDVDLALSGNPLKPHVPYKHYCDHVYTMRTSPSARAAVKYHLKRLKDFPKHKANFFPSIDRPMLLEDGKPDGHVHTFTAGGLKSLIRNYPQLKPSIVLKAATAIFLLYTTGYTHAIFAHWDSSRDKFPFTTPSSSFPVNVKASDVDGQLINPILNLISIHSGETKLAFLERLQEEQELQSKHAAAPWKEIMRGMDPETAELFPVYSTECVYNWLGTNFQSSNGYENLELVEVVNRRDVHRFYVGASLIRGESENEKVMLHIKGSVFTIAEMADFAMSIEKVATWLIEDPNMPIEGFGDIFRCA